MNMSGIPEDFRCHFRPFPSYFDIYIQLYFVFDFETAHSHSKQLIEQVVGQRIELYY